MNRSGRVALVAAAVAGCGDDLPARPVYPGLVPVRLEVPAVAAAPPFDEPRTVWVPPGYALRVVARVPTARFLAETPGGDLLVSHPGDIGAADGTIYRIADPPGAATTSTLAAGMTLPHDLVFATRAGVTYLYVAEHSRVSRAAWDPVTNTIGPLSPVVSGLPSASLPELHGGYGHALKNIAIGGDTLYVSIASATNSDPADALADPVRGSIYAYPADGGAGRLFARGLRNAEGLAFHPRTGELWAAVNHRDNVWYPLSDGVYAFREVVQKYVNDNPPEPFTRIRDGGNYGWPYCNPDGRGGFDRMPYLPDVENNAEQTVLDCSAIDRSDKGLPAHSAPLGLSFWTGAAAPAEYRDAAVIGMHGCWNCDVVHGYRVAVLHPRADGGFDDAVDLVAGFYPPEGSPKPNTDPWGRPVDVIPNVRGNLYISDDFAGAVYELYRP